MLLRNTSDRSSPWKLTVRFGVAAVAGLSPVAWATSISQEPGRLAASCILGWCLLRLAWIDWHSLRLPNHLTIPLMAAGLAVTYALWPNALAGHVAGALAGYAVLAGIAHLYRLTKGREGLGLGDAKLLAAGGAWLGWQALPVTVLVATGLTLLLVLALYVAGRDITRHLALPFGPPLAMAIWLVWLYGDPFAPV